MAASGGGDAPEAVADGLYDALNLTYRHQATKICVWIGDAEPHGLNPNNHDGFPEGCPSNHDPVRICHEMAAKGIILYCVGCEPCLTLYRDFFMGLSLITGGQYIRLQRARLLSQVIIQLTNEEVDNENLMGYVEDHIHLELQANPNATVDELADSLHTVLQLNNNRTRRMRYNGREIEPFTPLARRISHMHTLSQVAAAMLDLFQPGGARRGTGEADTEEYADITSIDMTDLDEVTPRQCERLVRRSLARNRQQARETAEDRMD